MAKFKSSNLLFKDNQKTIFGDGDDASIYWNGVELALDSALLHTSGAVTIDGDLIVSGTQFITETETVLIEDNLLVVNYGEPGAGVTEGWAGIEVDRGSETNYQFMFVEADDNFQVGISGSLQPVATREATPTAAGVAFWNGGAYRFDTDTDLTFVTDTLYATNVSGTFHGDGSGLTDIVALDEEATATASTPTVSATYEAMDSMTITPVAGTYRVHFNTSWTNGTSGSTSLVAVYYDTNIVSSSVRRLYIAGAQQISKIGNVTTTAKVTVNGSEAINIQWQTSAGTTTAYERSLVITKVAS